MPIEIEIQGVGIAEFPDDMPQNEIRSILRKKFPPPPADLYGATLSATPPLGLGEKVQRFFSPLIGPTEAQHREESIYDPATGKATYKPLGDKVAQEGFFPALSHPMVPIPSIDANDPRFEAFMRGATGRPTTETERAVVAGIINTGKGFAEFMESPLGLATGGTAAGPMWLKRIVGAFYAADIGRKTPEAARAFGEATVLGTPQEVVESGLGLATTVVLPGILGGHAVRPSPLAPRPSAPDLELPPFDASKLPVVPEPTAPEAVPVAPVPIEIIPTPPPPVPAAPPATRPYVRGEKPAGYVPVRPPEPKPEPPPSSPLAPPALPLVSPMETQRINSETLVDLILNQRDVPAALVQAVRGADEPPAEYGWERAGDVWRYVGVMRVEPPKEVTPNAKEEVPKEEAIEGKFRLRTKPDRLDAEIEGETGTLTARASTHENADGTHSVSELTVFVPPGILDPRSAPRQTVTLKQPITGRTQAEARQAAYQAFTDTLNQGEFVQEPKQLNAPLPSIPAPQPPPPIDKEKGPPDVIPSAEPIGQPPASAPRVDVREPAEPRPPTPPPEPAAPAPRTEEPAGPPPGAPTETGARPERRRSVRRGAEQPPGAPGRPGDVGQPPAAPAPEPARAGLPEPADVNHVLPAAEDWIPTGDRAKVRANLEAIKLLQRLEAENRPATPEEKAILAKYTGWGGLKEVFDEGKAYYRERPPWNQDQMTEFKNWEKNWGKLYDEVKAALPEEDWKAAARSILNAHYTSREIINAMWQAVKRLGFKGGQAIEPAGGIGHFMGLTPEDIRGKTRWRAVELDKTSARMMAALYPQARVENTGFETSRVGANTQDLAISNVPFAKEGPADKRYPNLSLHNYFFARALDLVRPGGVVAFITSDSTMDAPASRAARDYLAERADLVGAIRLPNTAFKKNAGTEVTTDILFFRKRDGTPFKGEEFRRLEATETYKGQPIEVNEYYVRHPEMLLGRLSLEGKMYGGGGEEGQRTLDPIPGAELKNQLDEAVNRLPQDIMGARQTPATAPAEAQAAAAGAKVGRLVTAKDGSPKLVADDGTLTTPDWGGDAKKVKQARSYLLVRDQALGIVERMLDPNATEADIAATRAALNKVYDDYFKRYGAINERRSGFLDDDVDFPLALALEDANTILTEVPGKGGKKIARRETTYTKSKLFTERTIFPRQPPERVDTVPDALQVGMNFTGRVDPEYIGRLTGRDIEAVKQELTATGLAFENPETGQWENRATYLSGYVKDKLKAAQARVEENPRYAVNVAELAKVQPPDIAIENIGVRLGSVWVPPEVIRKFMSDTLQVDAVVNYTPETGTWTVVPRSGQWSERNKTTFGIHDWKGHELVERALNLKHPVVTDLVPGEDGKTVERKNPTKTLEAEQKQSQLQDLFKEYVLKDSTTARALETIYNDRYNGVVAPKFDPPTWSHYPGASSDITLREHQKGVVSRILQNSTGLFHAVGTGKTFIMVTAAMEMRRLGLARKPMIVVQNATLEQFARSFKRLYPTARILAPNARQRDALNRNKTISRIATGDWDAVIIPQSFINMLPDNPAREIAYINDQTAELKAAINKARYEEGKKSIKAADMQKALERLEKRLEELKARKVDNVLTFEQLGVDALFVDEAHYYKKLEFSTQMDNIKGLDIGASQRGFSMMMKMRWVQEQNQGRNTVFATGTPVSNTIAEAWNMMRYLRPDVLKHYNIERFDDFASTFGDTITQLEMTAGGTWKPVTRFARYQNGPELIAAWRTVADVVTAEEVNLPGLPALKNGKTQAITIKQSPQLKAYVEYLRSELERFAAMSGRDKRDNSHIPLVVFGLAKKASLDMRMIDPSLADQPGSKLNVAADQIARIYQEAHPVQGAQMVFSDAYQNDPKNPQFNLYKEMKRKLVERGIPEDEIVIFDDTVKDVRGDTIKTKLNNGEIRVALGSSDRLGTGVNAQEHLIAVHHLDAPPRPMDVEQRNGRILRQGNSNPEIEIINYGVENTLDAAMFQKLATKQKFINQILRGDLQGRNFEDAANEQSLSFEEQMAAFSGDKRAMEKVGLENQVRTLESLKSGHFEQARKAREQIEHIQTKTIPWQERQVAEALRRNEVFSQAFAPEKDYTVTIGGRTITGRKEVAGALDALFKETKEKALATREKTTAFGPMDMFMDTFELNGQRIGMRVTAQAGPGGILLPDSAQVQWKFVDGEMGGSASTGAGFYHSLAAALERIGEQPSFWQRSLEGEKRNLRELSGFITQPFDREAELATARERLSALSAELEAEGKAPKTPPAAPEPPSEEHAMLASGALLPSKAATGVIKELDSFRAATAPQTRGEAARFAGNLLRELNATMANEMARADHALRPFRATFDRTALPKNWKYDPTLPLPRNLAFIEAYETGNTAALSPKEAQLAAEFHRQNAEWVDRVQALGTGALQHLIENYFPHIWENPAAARQVMARLLSKRPLEGPKSFLKQRTYELFREGLAAGLKPVHDNPVDLWLLKKREVERYIMARRFIDQMKAAGLMKFNYVFNRVPEGWSAPRDKAFDQWLPPSVTIKEAFDAGIRAKILEVLDKLGIPHERRARLGRMWGQETNLKGGGQEQIKTKFGGPDFVFYHELGHALDSRYPDLRQTLRATDVLKDELIKLSEERARSVPGIVTRPPSAKYILQPSEQLATLLQAYLHAPDVLARVAPTARTAFEAFLARHPELNIINEIRPTMVLGEGQTELSLAGPIKVGQWILPEAATRVVDNFLSPGLNPQLWYRSLREASNLLNGIQLGMSAFHLGFTSLDAAVSRMAVAIEDAMRGNLARAGRTLASVPVSPITNIRQGGRLRAEVLKPGSTDPQTAQLVRALEQAGGRIGQDRFWATEFSRRMTRAFREGTATGLAKGALNAPFALIEQTMRPIFEYVVPRQKLGVFADMAKRELLRLGPNADPKDVREALRRSWDSVDNRMGQIVYDNLFYNRAVKDVALLSFRAYGWQLGKYREGLGGVWDYLKAGRALAKGETPEFSHRMAYLMALPITVGILGGLAHYLMTGRQPQGMDYFMPQTGEKDRNGNPARLNFPSYLKDVIAYSKHPITSLGHALNPLFALIADLLQNKDFYDVQIRSPDDPLWRQGSDVAQFAMRQMVPFSVSGAVVLRQEAAPLHKQVLPFFGITPVPTRITMTPAQALASEIMSSQMPSGGRTREQFDRGRLLREFAAGIKQGQGTALRPELVNPQNWAVIMDRLAFNPLQFQIHLFSADQAMRVWRLATPAERESLVGIMTSKLQSHALTKPAEAAQWLAEINQPNKQ